MFGCVKGTNGTRIIANCIRSGNPGFSLLWGFCNGLTANSCSCAMRFLASSSDYLQVDATG